MVEFTVLLNIMRVACMVLMAWSIVLMVMALANAARLGWQKPYLIRVKLIALFAVSGVFIVLAAPMLNALLPHGLSLEGDQQKILRGLQGMDARLIEGVATIRTADNHILMRNTRVLGEYEFGIDGVYQPTSRTILLRNSASAETLHHEIFHDVWYNKLTRQERAEFKQIHETSASVTLYGDQHVEEDFADTGMYYVNNPLVLDTQRALFFDKIYQRLLNYNLTAYDTLIRMNATAVATE